MNISEVSTLLNIILPLVAVLGYVLRIITTWKARRFCIGKILLILYSLGSLYITFIFLTLITGWRSILAPDAETWSILYIRPFFTYLATLFILSSWTHPDLIPYTDRIKGLLWALIHRLTGKK